MRLPCYQGGHGCLVIPFSRSVCGAAARSQEIQIIADVEAFEDHIACSSSTKSELVISVTNGQGVLIAVFDIDVDQPNAFDTQDASALSAILQQVFERL